MKLSTESTVINDKKLNTNIDNAQETADQAKTIADNTAQYFWVKSTGDDTGAHISEKTQAQFEANPSGGNLLARSTGIAVRDGLTELATFGADGAQIGRSDDSHVTITEGDGMRVYVSEGGGSTGFLELASIACLNSASIGINPYYTLGRRGDGDIGSYSVAEGMDVVASGDSSHAEGSPVYKPSGTYANTEATGRASHAEGEGSHATGEASHAGGLGTIAGTLAQTAIGRWNVEDTTSALIVGNGTPEASYVSGSVVRSNAMKLGWNGNMTIAGTLTQSSDRRLKEHIEYLDEDADEFIRKLKPAHFKKDDADHVGFYAQDVEEADKWHCMTGEMNGYKTLGYTELIAPLVAYCQHLEKRIEELERSKNE